MRQRKEERKEERKEGKKEGSEGRKAKKKKKRKEGRKEGKGLSMYDSKSIKGRPIMESTADPPLTTPLRSLK